MKRPLHIWLVFGVFLFVATSAMIWLTQSIIQLDREQKWSHERLALARQEADLARNHAELQELISSSLWRMDWMLTPLVAQEATRPHFVYEPFYLDHTIPAAERHMASPLLVQPSEFVLLHFQLTPDNHWVSPQNPRGHFLQQALVCGVDPDNIKNSARLLSKLQAEVTYNDLLDLLSEESLPSVTVSAVPWTSNLSMNYNGDLLDIHNSAKFQELGVTPIERPVDPSRAPATVSQQPNRPLSEKLAAERNSSTSLKSILSSEEYVQSRGQDSFAKRSRATQQFAIGQRTQQLRHEYHSQNSMPADDNQRLNPVVENPLEGVSRPVWLNNRLLFARRVEKDGQILIQGCWLNWKKLRALLLEEVGDLLPNIELTPVFPAARVPAGRMLATLPIEVVTPPPAWAHHLAAPDSGSSVASSLSPLHVSLWFAWACLVLGSLAVGFVVRSVMNLSERRAAFVSAVTHELRTPLTTFRMYSEMLADDMISSPNQRQEYTKTLQIESERLSHLVENVLQYSRLENTNRRSHYESVNVRNLLHRNNSRLKTRAMTAGMELQVHLDEACASDSLSTDPSVIEQILFNLVDNACKYAGSASTKKIVISCRRNAEFLEICVRDFGPGITPQESKRLFHPFSKSADQAASSAPGVGLGLALCRRLARELRGRLTLLENKTSGAEFLLEIPIH